MRLDADYYFTLKPQRLQQWLRAGTWAAGVGKITYLLPQEKLPPASGNLPFALTLLEISTAGGYSPEKNSAACNKLLSLT